MALPDVLICAGLDPSGGAGLIADVRVVSALGGRPVGVVTALTVQSTTAVLASEPVSAELVREQLELLLSDIEVRAVKIGMIGASAVAESIGVALALTQAPVVWDPVMHPSRGEVTFADNLFGHAVIALAPHVTLLTPNAGELTFLAGKPIHSVADARAAGQALAAKLQCAVLAKGGHLVGADGQAGAEAVDVLCFADRAEELRLPRVPGGEHVHGTGCALSSAIAAHLAQGVELVEACRAAKAYVAAKIAAPARPGRGAAAMV
ncbi:MAG: bifunctional hydroxymethylpyrimidine kinase/phosphomethylpyrimidine kinase [Kofleriaceae bacterium]